MRLIPWTRHCGSKQYGTTIFGIISAENSMLATKVTNKVIR
jgi:hypothetical protein